MHFPTNSSVKVEEVTQEHRLRRYCDDLKHGEWMLCKHLRVIEGKLVDRVLPELWKEMHKSDWAASHAGYQISPVLIMHQDAGTLAWLPLPSSLRLHSAAHSHPSWQNGLMDSNGHFEAKRIYWWGVLPYSLFVLEAVNKKKKTVVTVVGYKTECTVLVVFTSNN